MSEEKLIFIDTPVTSSPERKIKFKSGRPLWQETNQSDDCGCYSADDEMEGDDIKGKVLSAEFICKTLGLKCTSKNGVCRECKLSRKYEKTYRSEKRKCAQQ